MRRHAEAGVIPSLLGLRAVVRGWATRAAADAASSSSQGAGAGKGKEKGRGDRRQQQQHRGVSRERTEVTRSSAGGKRRGPAAAEGQRGGRRGREG